MTLEPQAILDAWGAEFNKAQEEGTKLPVLPEGFEVMAGSWKEKRNDDGTVVVGFRLIHSSDAAKTSEEILQSGRGLMMSIKPGKQ